MNAERASSMALASPIARLTIIALHIITICLQRLARAATADDRTDSATSTTTGVAFLALEGSSMEQQLRTLNVQLNNFHPGSSQYELPIHWHYLQQIPPCFF
ncbi:unnamed protein product [Heligmosomoides polygyrus]|uniref:Secreted protein n=1 Tax=Heligmosomoides polygyrus TaxID=6339 RepID=A0A183FP70_HELPZ|nr:unnamed protein product [Heligmosomoides polygyrus]